MNIVLFGAGAAGRYALKFIREKGIEPICFADNDKEKLGTLIDGIQVTTPYLAQARCVELNVDAEWVACAISRPAATEIRAEMRSMGVKTKPLWECIPVFHGLPPEDIRYTLFPSVGDVKSKLLFNDQCFFRKEPDYDDQVDPDPFSEIYFPAFIKHLRDEVFIDCGAADGDTVTLFMQQWDSFKIIIAFEPDYSNYHKLLQVDAPLGKMTRLRMAVSDHDGSVAFCANGDYSSHIGVGPDMVRCVDLDHFLGSNVPTYIKMDIEGAELEALWGARHILKEHMPVLAICSYHTSDHLWEIPLLIHAIQPSYKMFFRRYGEGAFETVWYAVPPERVI